LKLESLIKVALDELRMQMLGVQVLFGFQFQGIFQEGFDDVSALGRRIDALGLALMVVVLGCLPRCKVSERGAPLEANQILVDILHRVAKQAGGNSVLRIAYAHLQTYRARRLHETRAANIA
jgi:hypothetical protein